MKFYEPGEGPEEITSEAEIIAELQKPSDHVREYFRATCFFNLERADFYLRWNNETGARRKKKRDRLVLTKDKKAVEGAVHDIEMTLGIVEEHVGGNLPIHCIATFGNACHIIGMICTLCQSQKLYWDRLTRGTGGKKLADLNNKATDMWLTEKRKQLHFLLEGSPEATIDYLTEETFSRSVPVKYETYKRYYVVPERRAWKASKRRSAFKVV